MEACAKVGISKDWIVEKVIGAQLESGDAPFGGQHDLSSVKGGSLGRGQPTAAPV